MIGASVIYLILPEVEKNVDEVYVLEKDYSFQTGQLVTQSKAKKFYKTYIHQKVKKSKYSKKRKGDEFMNNKDKERYLDLDSNTIKGIRLIQKKISPKKPDTVGLRLFLGIQKQSANDTDYVYIATYNAQNKIKEDVVKPQYYIIDIADDKSPTCPIECDNRDYENPF